MKTLLIALLLLTATACGGSVQTTQCRITGLGPVTAYYEMDCAVFQDNFDFAKQVLAERGLVPQDALSVYENVPVVVHFEMEWHEAGIGVVTGVERFPGSIGLNTEGDALVHEMLHYWQGIHFILNTGDHPHWDTNGYYDADNYFTGHHKPLYQATPN